MPQWTGAAQKFLSICGAMQDLYGIWENIGSEWVGTGVSDSAAPARDSPEAVPELSPQQLQLVQEHFDRVRGHLLLAHPSRHNPTERANVSSSPVQLPIRAEGQVVERQGNGHTLRGDKGGI